MSKVLVLKEKKQLPKNGTHVFDMNVK